MFVHFFHDLKSAQIPVSLREYLTLLEGLDRHVIGHKVDEFYYLARACLVKDERHLDKFDQVFSKTFEGIENNVEGINAEIPEDWLRKLTEKFLTEEEKAQIESLGGWDNIMETLKKRLEEQKGRHQGGSKWVGTGGTSPFGAYGYNPEGIRIGQDKSRHKRAIKVWDKREFKNLDGDVQLGTRNIKMALRRLRQFARNGEKTQLNIDKTIKATAHSGSLDIHMQAERRNNIKVLLFFDIGGSMDMYVQMCEELFSAAKGEFKNMEYFYFHNCLYEGVWQDNQRRHTDKIPTWDVLHKYPADYKIIFIGDAAMSPYEIAISGGSVEHTNEEAGGIWLQRVMDIYENVVWINPTEEQYWGHTQSTLMIQQIVHQRMFPLTLEGLDKAMRTLTRGK